MPNLRSLPLCVALLLAGYTVTSSRAGGEVSHGANASADIAWQSSYDKALDAAKTQHQVIFIAVNMDGESANDGLAKESYKDPVVVSLTNWTVNVIASLASHSNGSAECTRFKGIACAAHQSCEKSVRNGVLKADETGNIVAPQHVFLDSTGKPLLSVPYEVSVQELEWCLVTAIKKADPASKVAMPPGAHMPSRVVLGAVYDPKEGVGGAIKPLTKAEVGALIKEVKRGVLDDDKRQVAFWGILHSDSPEALSFIQAELRSGGAGPTEGGGNGGGGQANSDGGGYKHQQILRAMGAVSPPIYWEMAADFIGNDDEDLRLEASAALEQMAAPQALSVIDKQLSKEKKPEIKKDLVRALASCGARDAKVRAAVMKRARTEKNELVRVNAVVALGLLEQEADVRACVQEMLAAKEDSIRIAAAVAAALSRDESYIAILEPLKKPGVSAGLDDALTRSLEVLRGSSIRRLQKPLSTICQDKVPRERTLGLWEE